MSLRQAALSGVFWTGLSSYLGQALQLLTLLILAGLLAPKDFGTFALASLAIALLGLVRGLGLGEALIQFQGEITEAADTAFWLQLAVGATLFGVSFALAPLAAAFFTNPTIEPIIRVLSISFIFFALQGIHARLLERALRFRTNALPGLVGGAVYALVAMSLAWQGWGVWSIVYASVTQGVITTALYWALTSYRPAFRFNWETAQRLMRFGGFAQANTILIFLHRIVDRAAVGRLLGTTATGYYDLGFRIGNLPESRITFLFYGVAFPLYSRLQGDLARLARVHLTATRYLALVAAPTAFAIAAISPTLIEGLYGDKWLPAIPALVVFSLHGLTSAVLGPSGIVFYALGKPALETRIDGIKLFLVVGSIYFVARAWGFVGVAVLMTSLNVVSGLIAAWLASRLLDISLVEILQRLVPPIGLGLALLPIPLAILHLAPWNVGFLLQAAAAALFYGLAYAVVVYVFDASVRGHVRLLLRHPRRGFETLLKESAA